MKKCDLAISLSIFWKNREVRRVCEENKKTKKRLLKQNNFWQKEGVYKATLQQRRLR